MRSRSRRRFPLVCLHHPGFGKRSLAIEAAAQLRTRLAEYESDARSDIQTEINKILKIAARRAYRFEFAEDFTMSLHLENVEGPVPKSGGENQ
ncbi:hypothetical protein [Sphingomonas bacterium]|uniref:hypothetical protein n=1 Tax=Sphingomonas bacterium TaxID=1895847 RepID=UPI0015775418|nr:hypothetical protein [Sphingomonas bacterium]